MSRRYKLVLFDFDGTLADSFAWFVGAVSVIACKHPLRPFDLHGVDRLRHLVPVQHAELACAVVETTIGGGGLAPENGGRIGVECTVRRGWGPVGKPSCGKHPNRYRQSRRNAGLHLCRIGLYAPRCACCLVYRISWLQYPGRGRFPLAPNVPERTTAIPGAWRPATNNRTCTRPVGFGVRRRYEVLGYEHQYR